MGCLLLCGMSVVMDLLRTLKGFKFPKVVHLDPVLFDIKRDLLTPTYKKKREQLLKYYQTKEEKTSQQKHNFEERLLEVAHLRS